MSFYQKVLALLLLIHIGTVPLRAQVWPGDVNNNGVVNAVDWLYLGSVVEEIGPPRSFDQMGIEWEEKTVSSFWGLNFPGTAIDYAFADCNGDGFVGIDDFDAINDNYFLEHGIVTDDESTIGEAGSDPQLFFDNSAIIDPFPQGFILGLNLNLGTPDIPVESLTGIAFSIKVNPDIVQFMAFMPAFPDESDWEFPSLFLQQFDPIEGQLDVALSTLNDGAIENAFGTLGEFFIVIEDDVVGMQDDEVQSEFELANIFLLGSEDFSPLPIVGDTANVTIIDNPLSNENLIDPQHFEVFPNPVLDELYIKSDYQIDRVGVFSTIGQNQLTKSYEDDINPVKKLSFVNLNPGIYFIKIHTNNGIATRKVLHR